MIEAKIIADSSAPSEVRVTTYVLTYPRFIHSEFMTHRMFSRNASSSRAIPVKKQIQMVLTNPAIPLAFTRNKPGMQGGEALTGDQAEAALTTWLDARNAAVLMANKLVDLEVHKQYVNRILEPFAHISVVCTATDFANFFALRLHKDAQPEIAELAKQMWIAYCGSQPEKLQHGDWHLPFLTEKEKTDSSHDTLSKIKWSAARCARTSYLNHEGVTPSIEEDFGLYAKLAGGFPLHASPMEHQAMAERNPNIRSGNFRGWTQYRKTLKNENVTEFQGPDLDSDEQN